LNQETTGSVPEPIDNAMRGQPNPCVAWGIELGLRKGILHGLQKGLQQGIQKGLQRGARQGAAAVVLRLLSKRIGPLPVGMQRLVHGLDLPRLEALGEALLDFTSHEQVRRWLESDAG